MCIIFYQYLHNLFTWRNFPSLPRMWILLFLRSAVRIRFWLSALIPRGLNDPLVVDWDPMHVNRGFPSWLVLLHDRKLPACLNQIFCRRISSHMGIIIFPWEIIFKSKYLIDDTLTQTVKLWNVAVIWIRKWLKA